MPVLQARYFNLLRHTLSGPIGISLQKVKLHSVKKWGGRHYNQSAVQRLTAEWNVRGQMTGAAQILRLSKYLIIIGTATG